MNKPQKTQPKTPNELQERDFFQTPNYATDLMVPYLLKDWMIWECASGGGKIVDRLRGLGFNVFGTDLQTGHNFFEYEPPYFDAIVTNIPFSLKPEFYKRALNLGAPFAFLMPLDFCGWILRAMQDENIQWLVPTRRIDYITPTGRQGKNSAAQYHSGWFCYKMNLPKQITVVELSKEMKAYI